MPVSKARAELADLIDEVNKGNEVTLTRHGQAVARLVRADPNRTPRTEAAWAAVDALRDRMAKNAAAPFDLAGGMTAAEVDEWVEEIHRDRGERW